MRARGVLHRGRDRGAGDARTPGEAALFGEGPGGVIVAGPREVVEALEGALVIGVVGGESLEIDGRADRAGE